MNSVVRGKKVLNIWHEYNITNTRGTIVDTIIGSKNYDLLYTDDSENIKLFSMKTKSFVIDMNDKRESEDENLYILNEKNEILVEDVKVITKVGNSWDFILELDTNSKKWKSYSKRKSDRLFCIINHLGEIVKGPTTKPIKYIPCVDIVIIENQRFPLHHSQDSFEIVKELISDNTYLVKRGDMLGILFGQAHWHSSKKMWDNYSNIQWFPSEVKSVECFRTHIPDLYILKVNEYYRFYRVAMSGVGHLNRFFGNKYIRMHKLFNNYILENIGFICIRNDGRIDYTSGVQDKVVEFDISDIQDAVQLVRNNLEKQCMLYDDLDTVYPAT